MTFDFSTLQSGDSILYSTSDLVDGLIEDHTGGPVAHIEVYEGQGQSVASRNGLGVNRYPLRTVGAIYVLRPNVDVDVVAATEWFETVKGEGYDWVGLLNFFRPGETVTPHELFCSAFGCLWYRAGKANLFHPSWYANKLSPVDYLKVPGFTWVGQ